MGQIQYLGMLMLWYKFSMAVMDRSILEGASMRSALVRSHSSMKGLIGWLVPLPLDSPLEAVNIRHILIFFVMHRYIIRIPPKNNSETKINIYVV